MGMHFGDTSKKSLKKFCGYVIFTNEKFAIHLSVKTIKMHFLIVDQHKEVLMTTTTQYIEYKTIYGYVTKKEIQSRNMEVVLPPNCLAYRFSDIEMEIEDRQIIWSGTVNVTPWKYQGKKLSHKELEEYARNPVHAPNIGDIRFCYGGVLTKSGFVFPLEKGDEVFE